jgi:hypothetical protein
MLGSSVRSFALKSRFKATDVSLPDVFFASTLQALACTVVDDTTPPTCRAITRHTELTHREPICIGEKIELGMRVQKVEPNLVTFDVNVVQVRDDRQITIVFIKIQPVLPFIFAV